MPSPYVSPVPPAAIFPEEERAGVFPPIDARDEPELLEELDFIADIPVAPVRLPPLDDPDFRAVDLVALDFRAPDVFAVDLLALDFFEADFFEAERALLPLDRVPEEDFRADDFLAPPEEARPRAEAPLRAVFLAPPELFLFPLLAAFPADFFFLATLCSSSPGSRRCPRSYNSEGA